MPHVLVSFYAYVQRKGYGAEDAQDLTQEFFARLLARNYLSVAHRNKGKFRSFLLGALEHFLAREWTKAMRKNGAAGKPSFLSMRWMLRIGIFWNRPRS